MTEPQKKAFDFAADATKQLITLSSGIIALTVTFSKDILYPAPGDNGTAQAAAQGRPGVLVAAWIFYLLSIILGVLTLQALTGALSTAAPSINSPTVRYVAWAQAAIFLIATIIVVYFGYDAVT